MRRRWWMRSVASAACAVALVGSASCGAPPDVASAREEAGIPAVDAGVNVGPLPGVQVAAPPPGNPFTGNQEALANGRRYFNWYNCAGCHGTHGGGGMGPSLRDEQWLYGDADAQIVASIMNGRANGMPAWGAMLTDEQVWQLAAYIKSMRTPDEPNPPRVN